MRHALRLNLVSVLLAVGLLSHGASAAPKAAYVKLTSSSDGPPLAYAEIRGSQLRVARTAEGIGEAEAVRASETEITRDRDMAYQHSTFPSVDLPVQTPAGAKVSAKFSVWRGVSRRRSRRQGTEDLSVSAEISVAKRSRSAVLWTYVFNSYTEASSATRPSKAASLTMPSLEKLQLTMETQVKGSEAGIGLRVKSGDIALTQVLRDGQAAVCTLEIYDRHGQRVSTHKGDLQKFGFT